LSAETLSAALAKLIEPQTLQRMAEATRALGKPNAIDSIIDRVHALTGAL